MSVRETSTHAEHPHLCRSYLLLFGCSLRHLLGFCEAVCSKFTLHQLWLKQSVSGERLCVWVNPWVYDRKYSSKVTMDKVKVQSQTVYFPSDCFKRHYQPPCSPLFTTLCGPKGSCRGWQGNGQHLSTHLSCFSPCLCRCNFWWMRSG